MDRNERRLLFAFVSSAATTPAFAAALAFTPAAFAATAATLARRRLNLLLLQLLPLRLHVRAEVRLAEDLTPVDPHLHARRAVDRIGRAFGVVDVRADRVERDAPFQVLLGAAHLGAAEAAGDLDAHALGAHPHGRRDGLLHRTPERDTPFELLRDVLRHEARVQLGPLDLADVDLDVLVRELLQLFAELLDLGTAAPDHDARPARVQREDDALGRPLDHNAAEARP